MPSGSAAGSPLPGHARNFGKYSLVLKLATGGMAEIFLARLKGVAGFEKLVVIKRILPHLADDEQFVNMFLDEARIAARISHPNVCQVYELGEVEGQYFIAMEYLEGATLTGVMRRVSRDRKSGDLRLTGGLVAQACEGLHHAHELRDLDGAPVGVIHRDVSPQNLFCTIDGVLKVLDFGIAKAQGASAKTRTGTVKGKYAYMSPEQLRGETLDRRADVWALGIVLFEGLTGRRLFWRDTDFLIFKAITEEPIPRVREYRPDVPPELDAVVQRALSRGRDDRFPSARAMGEAIGAALASQGGALLPGSICVEIERMFGDDVRNQRTLVAQATADGPEADTTERLPFGDPVPAGGTALADAPTASLPTPSSGTRRPAEDAAVAATVEPAASRSAPTRAMRQSAPTLPLPPPPEEPYEGATARLAPTPDRSEAAAAAPDLVEDDGSGAVTPAIEPVFAVDATGQAVLRPSGRSRGGWFVFVVLVAGAGAAGYLLTRGSGGYDDVKTTEATLATGGATTGPADAATRRPVVDPIPVADPVVDAAPDPAPVPDPDLPPDPAPATAPDAGPTVTPRPPTPRPQKPPRPPPAAPGYITIDSTPYATIYIDGKKQGITPLARIPLPPGKHRVRAVSSAGGEKIFTVTITSGRDAPPRKLVW